MPSLQMAIPASLGAYGLGSGIRIGRALAAKNWVVSAIGSGTPPASDIPNLRLDGVHTEALMRFAFHSPARWREDWLVAISNATFDRLSAPKVRRTDVFYGYPLASLQASRVARRLSSTTVLHATEVCVASNLEREYRRLGLKHAPIGAWAVRRSKTECAEADLIRVESNLIKERLLEQGIAENRIHLAPASIDLARYRVPRQNGDGFTVLFVGSFSVRKGVHYLLEAWRIFRDADTQLVLNGHVSNRWAKDLIHPLLSDSAVEVRAGDPLPAYQRASVCVVPSLEDGYGLVVLEAMAAGVPVIVSEGVGAKDAIIDGNEGFIVPVGDAGAIAERVCELRAHPSQLREMSAAARLRSAEFSAEAEAAALTEGWGVGTGVLG